jgi:peptidoglycan/LPS O-acetylase OafA/YrhL
MQRINWIDWVKAWCMTVVVFDHTPHDGSPFLLQFLAGTNLASFFFISGYLKKPSVSQKESLKKYAYCLLIPYLIYNAIFYPYWIGKTYIERGGMPSFSECLKPIIGTFLGQLDSSFSCQLNGVTWFLISLFIMHWITDVCNRQKNGKAWMLGISIIAMVLYGLNKYVHFAPYLSFHGLVRCIPFFFLGNILRQTICLKEVKPNREFAIGIVALVISLFLFYLHIHQECFIFHIILYYIVNCASIFAIICLWRCANNVNVRIVVWISIGTMVIFGLHRIIIGAMDFFAESVLNIIDIEYSLPEAICITICVEIILLPIIFYAYRHCQILLGKKKTSQNLVI